jgi:hypothetical protein
LILKAGARSTTAACIGRQQTTKPWILHVLFAGEHILNSVQTFSALRGQVVDAASLLGHVQRPKGLNVGQPRCFGVVVRHRAGLPGGQAPGVWSV